MSKVAVVYWSGTGNTEEMANKVAEGAKAAGAEVEVISADDFDGTDISSFDGVAFGCPAMGDEELEDSVFQPVFEACEPKLAGKKVALFGSYGWGVEIALQSVRTLFGLIDRKKVVKRQILGGTLIERESTRKL